MNKEERLRNPETCWHVFLRKQTGPLDDGPAKSTRYRCTNPECGAFVVAEPYSVEVKFGATYEQVEPAAPPPKEGV